MEGRDDRAILVYSVGADGVAQEHVTFVNWNATFDDLLLGRGAERVSSYFEAETPTSDATQRIEES